MTMNKPIQTNCKYTNMISCENTAACSACGWNPKVKDARIKQFMRERAKDMKKKSKQCPLRGYSIPDQKRDLGMTLNCFSSACELTPEGDCKVLAAVLEFWKSKCNSQAVGLSTKGEDAHEQPN